MFNIDFVQKTLSDGVALAEKYEETIIKINIKDF
tara:strand:- start:241 stop:342 length:102 start_codon:yes stop_codon:yes gene_type:complete